MILMLAVNSQNVDYSLRLGHPFSIDLLFFLFFFSSSGGFLLEEVGNEGVLCGGFDDGFQQCLVWE